MARFRGERGYEPCDYVDEHAVLEERRMSEPCKNFISEGGICDVCHFSWREHPPYTYRVGQLAGKEWRDRYLRRQEDQREANERS